MNKATFVLRSLVFVSGTAVLSLACLTSESSDDPTDQDIVPAPAVTDFDQIELCQRNIAKHAGIDASDRKSGELHWNCADVAGVTAHDRGQEYCEYAAVSNGKVVASAANIAAGKKMQCLFTSFYADAKISSSATAVYRAWIAADLAKAENLGIATDPATAVMNVGFNSRAAATDLIGECAGHQPLEGPQKIADLTKETRQIACWQAANAATSANKTKLLKLCRGQDLTKASLWTSVQKLGAKVLVGDETQQELASCLHIRTVGFNTTAWRNSDARICQRATRASAECKCDYAAIPGAFEGFTFTGWTNALPGGCRYSKIAGADSKNSVICDLTAKQQSDLAVDPVYSEDLKAFCNETFGINLVMSAPLRALEKPGTCKTDTAFCKQYAGK